MSVQTACRNIYILAASLLCECERGLALRPWCEISYRTLCIGVFASFSPSGFNILMRIPDKSKEVSSLFLTFCAFLSVFDSISSSFSLKLPSTSMQSSGSTLFSSVYLCRSPSRAHQTEFSYFQTRGWNCAPT